MAWIRSSTFVPWMAALLVACGGDGTDGSGQSPPSTSGDSEDGPESDGSATAGALPECNDFLPQTSGAVDDDSGGDGSSSGAPTAGMGDDMPLLTSPDAIQRGEIDTNTFVRLEGLVVTTPAAGSEGLIGFEQFLQDPAGGPWSGIRMHFDGEALLDVIQPGDVINIEGHVERVGDIPRVSIVGGYEPLASGEVPPPDVVMAADLVEGSELVRSYEAVYIRVEQPVVTNASLCSGEFEIEDGTRVDDRYAPGVIEVPPQGSMLAAVQGVLIHGTDGIELAPRSADEIERP